MRSLLWYWTLRFCAGLAVLLGGGTGVPSAAARGLGGHGSYLPLDVLLGLAGFWIAFTAVSPLVQALSADARLRREWGSAAHSAFARASTPQQVFLLLLAVIEADGRAGPAERELVRTFLLRRFADPGVRSELDHWSAMRPPRDVEALARRVAHALDPSECATIYSWSCLCAFADGDLRAAEFRVLQQIARGLGLLPQHAMFLFEFAQRSARANRQRQGAAAGATDGRAGNRRVPPQQPAAARDRALSILGLPGNASQEQIRQRHRELARRFHPDAQRRLGPVAQQEATERFVAIQRAYEELGG